MRIFLYALGAWIFSAAVILLVLWIGSLKAEREKKRQNIMRQVNNASPF